MAFLSDNKLLIAFILLCIYQVVSCALELETATIYIQRKLSNDSSFSWICTLEKGKENEESILLPFSISPLIEVLNRYAFKNFIVKKESMAPKEAFEREVKYTTILADKGQSHRVLYSRYPYLFLSFIEGLDLYEVATYGHHFLDLPFVMFSILELAKLVKSCQELNFLHGDIKPENILVAFRPLKLYLLDLGSAHTSNLIRDDADNQGIFYKYTPEFSNRRYTCNEWPDKHIDLYCLCSTFIALLQFGSVRTKEGIDSYGLACFEANKDDPVFSKMDELRKKYLEKNNDSTATNIFVSLVQILETCFKCKENQQIGPSIDLLIQALGQYDYSEEFMKVFDKEPREMAMCNSPP